MDQLGHLDEAERATATLLRERMVYLARTHPDEKDAEASALTRLVREEAFTVLNRLAALRLAEKRGLIEESVGKGYQSKGFKVFETVATTGLGDTYRRYRQYLLCLSDELALDLGALFDRRSQQGVLFPRESTLLPCLELINAGDVDELWGDDETIGWVYQYYNDPAERKKMRESPAPRNSRELAVRNQFFTPRYVVEFLTDNTLGRVWYEMTQGRTECKDRCRYLVRRPAEVFLAPGQAAPGRQPHEGLTGRRLLEQPVYIPHRPLKDPREIRMLDPACGSMHFGLYAFDLFEIIYSEAWDIAKGPNNAGKCTAGFTPFVSLVAQYASKTAFIADVPRLIIERNLHGIDIDPRATQIAGLSLWLRAQRSWQQQRVRPQDRPRIRRSNIVCAEPMPGDEALLDDFIDLHVAAVPERRLLGQLVRRVFAAMRLAGEAGSLLKIEGEVAGAVSEAAKQWLAGSKLEQGRLFGVDSPIQGALELDVTDVSDESFWERAEEQIYAALGAYAERAELGSRYHHRLFGDDAARGFAFIDLCRKRYDCVLMNPPFGAGVPTTAEVLASDITSGRNDIYSSFMSRAIGLLNPGGRVGALTSRTFLMLSSFVELRRYLVAEHRSLSMCADLGMGVLDDAGVYAAASVFWGSK